MQVDKRLWQRRNLVVAQAPTRQGSQHGARQPRGWASTQHMAHDCVLQATHRSPPTCRLPNNSGSVAILFSNKCLQGRSHSMVHVTLVGGPAHNTWHITACCRQLTGCPQTAGCQTTLAASQSGFSASSYKAGVTAWCTSPSWVGQHTTHGT